MKRKILTSSLSLVLAFAAVSSSLPGAGSCTADETKQQDGVTTVRGVLESTDVDYDYFYSDSLFAVPATEYSIPLADCSLVTSLSAYDDDVARSYLGEIGFTDITVNDGYEKNDWDNIGLVAGYKTININGTDYDLFEMTVRGTGYGAEWVSNFEVGSEGDHNGFDKNSDRALAFIKEYISAHDTELPDKIWIQGYSRGGAVSYMTGKKLLDDGMVKDQESLYIYTFSSPKGATQDSDITCIHNVVNSMDIIQRMFPSDWGFGRYGETIVLGDPSRVDEIENSSRDSNRPVYDLGHDFVVRSIDLGSIIDGGGFEGKTASTQYSEAEFCDMLVEFFEGKGYKDSLNDSRVKRGNGSIPAFASRKDYAETYQDALMYLVTMITSGSSITGVFDEDLLSSLGYSFLTESFDKDQDYKDTVKTVADLLSDMSPDGTVDEGHILTLARLLGKLLRMDSGAGSMMGLAFAELTMIPTFSFNADYIIRGHYADVLMSWIRDSYDPDVVAVSVDTCGNMPDGTVTLNGECVVTKGTEVTVSAACEGEDCIFNGWKDKNGNVLSTDTSYTFKATSDISVYADYSFIPVTGVALNIHGMRLTTEKDRDTLMATVKPDDAGIKSVIWKSSDPNVACVDGNGQVIAVSSGKAVITVTTKDGGFTDTCEVTVELDEETVEDDDNGGKKKKTVKEDDSNLLLWILSGAGILLAAAAAAVAIFFRKKRKAKPSADDSSETASDAGEETVDNVSDETSPEE